MGAERVLAAQLAQLEQVMPSNASKSFSRVHVADMIRVARAAPATDADLCAAGGARPAGRLRRASCRCCLGRCLSTTVHRVVDEMSVSRVSIVPIYGCVNP